MTVDVAGWDEAWEKAAGPEIDALLADLFPEEAS